MSDHGAVSEPEAAPARVDPLPDHLDLLEERSALGGTTGQQIVRCSICLATAPADEWRTLTHKIDCKHPVESYQTANGELVVQSLGSAEEWVSSSTPMEREDAAQTSDVDWTDIESELGEDR